jgi:Flp pilus assembly protein TadD
MVDLMNLMVSMPRSREMARSLLGLAFASLYCLTLVSCGKPAATQPHEFNHWMNVGKNQYEQGQTNAIAAFEKALALRPASPEAHLNLASALLLASLNEPAWRMAVATLELDPNSAAARYVAGCACLRLGKNEDAIKFLQECLDMDVKINAVSFQLARAHQNSGHYPEAAELLRSVIQWEPQHASAHYVLSQVLARQGKTEEAQQEARRHAEIKSAVTASISNPEKCVYLEVRAPFVIEEPVPNAVPVVFKDITAVAFGADARNYCGPAGIIDINQRGQNDLFVQERDGGFRVLLNSNGVFRPQGPKFPSLPGAKYTRCLVADINNDRFDDVAVCSDLGIQLFKGATNGAFTEVTANAGMKRRAGIEGALADIDLTGKLDLFTISPTNHQPQFLRNLGPLYFKDITATSGIPASLTNARQIAVEDWNGDDLMDLIVARDGQPPLILLKQRGGGLIPTNPPAAWPAGNVIAVGDLNNDYRTDLIIAAANRIEIVFGGMDRQLSLPINGWPVNALKLVDYDNDGWLDIVAVGKGLRIWRNQGESGFLEMTEKLGLQALAQDNFTSILSADFDQDGDIDFILGLEAGGLRFLRNEGGNANHLLKLRLAGNRSNASGLGVRLEVKAGNWRALRTVTELPIEIGLGKQVKPEVVKPRWSDLALPVNFELSADPKTVWTVMEIEQPTGSCPYLYAWNGETFRFVTDILGGSPLGLRVSDDRFVEADPEEYIALGDKTTFIPKSGEYLLQTTEELREVLYLDEAKLVIVDHPPGIRVYTTSKMMPGKPFVPHELVGLENPHPLLRAENHWGTDVTATLRAADGRFVSPTQLRVPQLRGLAEPSSVTLDFGPLPVNRPLVLVLNGWLRFGGGMANVAASQDPNLPFPFPKLEVEVIDSATKEGTWKPVDLMMGVPCGKTKTILVDLSGKLPEGARRLRISTAYELHWDQASLFEKAAHPDLRITRLAPTRTDLHWRGFSDFQPLPWYCPLTPDYLKARPDAHWRITPAGWCTRYGSVDELVAAKDNSLVLINGGDELTLAFAADKIASEPPGYVREFFFYSVGWDKDSDFHVACGTTVEPLPFHGMEDQAYGRQLRPVFANDGWITNYNTRWVGPLTLSRKP